MATKNILPLLFLTLLIGCTNLKEVRSYAEESAKFSAYTELTKRFRDTYYREQPYLSSESNALAQQNDKKRKAAYDDLQKINKTITLYMQTLAILAGDDTFTISKNIGSLSDGIKTHPDLGIDDKSVNAITNITKVITQWMTSAHQERAIKNMVKEGNEPLQTTLAGMITLIHYYRETNDNERKTVLGFFDVELPFADAPEDKLLATLARAHKQTKETEYDIAQQKYKIAAQGIKNIADGHQKLFDNIEKLSKSEIKTSISKFAKDIRSIRNNLNTL